MVSYNFVKHYAQFEKTNESLLTFSSEIKRLRKFLLDNGQEDTTDELNKEATLKKALKSKEVEDDNKKLRKLLK